MIEAREKFMKELVDALRDNTFVKLTLGNYKGSDKHLQKIMVRLVSTRKGVRMFFLFRGDMRDTAKNFDIDEGVSRLREYLTGDFFSGHLFTTTNDFQLEIGKRGGRLNTAKPTFKAKVSIEHDREKKTQVDSGAFYLKALGITDDNGRVRDKQQDKWRQINKFVEVLASLIDGSVLKDASKLSLVDMGSGKGYLTFAAYDHFANTRGIDVNVTGVDTKSELVELCNEVALAAGFHGLKFVVGNIASYEIGNTDVLIALHACNTATDDAIFKGIAAQSQLIVVAPCCHQEIRPQITPPPIFRDVLKHGIMLERMAEFVTDGLRSLLLERSGYSTKLFEFISTEHTPKNNMLVGTRLTKGRNIGTFQNQIEEIKATFGIDHQHLESLLNTDLEGSNYGRETTVAR